MRFLLLQLLGEAWLQTILTNQRVVLRAKSTSIEAVSFALRVSLEEAPKIRTVKSTSCVSKKNKTFHRKAFSATFHTSTHLFNTCVLLSLAHNQNNVRGGDQNALTFAFAYLANSIKKTIDRPGDALVLLA